MPQLITADRTGRVSVMSVSISVSVKALDWFWYLKYTSCWIFSFRTKLHMRRQPARRTWLINALRTWRYLMSAICFSANHL